MEQDNIDDILGITRCVRCGHRLDGEIECPFCAAFPDDAKKERVPKWIYFTACFLTSPLSLYSIIKNDRLSNTEKVVAFSGCFAWLIIYGTWFL